MTHANWDHELDDYLDGRLDSALQSRFLEHVSNCAECRDALADLEAVVTEAKQLPRTMDPPRALWSRIAARVAAERGEESDDISWGERGKAGWRAGLAAAAALALFWIAAEQAPRSSHPETPFAVSEKSPHESGPIISVIDEQGMRRPSSWARVIWTLEEETMGAEKAFYAGFVRHPNPAALARAGVIEPGMQALDDAIGETAKAMRVRPDDPKLARALAGYYERKLELLRLATRLATET
ncbi:MAG TPA: zf-HC2 domain-containing protein [Candidatus Eisenbacteria bacterium]|nr:zf-HC2 domain-containing protein [Candidatus Eisenbacteria bacterium]